MISPNEIMHGGMQNGVHVDPVTYVLAGLHARFSPLEEESRLTAMTEMMAFARRPGETINSVLSRYETVRQRAAMEGQFKGKDFQSKISNLQKFLINMTA